jgi:N-sulfoglucosamine sulfohydrolase
VAEDLSPYLPMYGDSTVETPNLSWLAAEGICYDNFFSPAPVCAPARAAIATGMYPNRIGANHMRTGPWFMGKPTPQMLAVAGENSPDGLIAYEAVPPPEVKMMSEYLRIAGYYCTNNAKEDYQFLKPETAWDESGPKAHWRNRPAGQPFFSVINFGVTHESQIWAKAKDSLWIPEDMDVPVPPYLPDTEVGLKDIRRMYSNIKEMDFQVGKILQQLKDDGLLENTVIFWYSDHGGPLPRQKRLLYDSGLKVPMIIRFPEKQLAGKRDGRLISFIDLAPTVMSLADIEPKAHFDGQAFLGKYMSNKERPYIFACADRFGPTTDNNRAACDKRFKYIKYYHPEKTMFLHVPYRDQMAIMQELYRLRDEGRLTEAQAQWFRPTKPAEELFDTEADPHELRNLANDPAYAKKLKELREACLEWVKAIDDKNLQPEEDLIREFWPNMEQPATQPPVVHFSKNEINISCATPGASIGYQIIEPGKETPSNRWMVYDKPFNTMGKKEILVIAHRIGYSPSEPVRQLIP